MATTPAFKYAPMFQLGEDKTEYRLLSKDGVTTAQFEGKEMIGDRSDEGWQGWPSPEVVYQMELEYLAALCSMMHEKYNREYVWGRRTLKDDGLW